MHVVRGAVKDYDWGIVDGLARWTGQRTGQPQAELWFGVHPGGPSPVIDPSGGSSSGHLADHFDIEHIPILVKLLAAARPLSVQVHPSASRARELWDAQVDGSGRPVLSDPFEKTEMLVALEPFEAFAGWRPADQAASMLDRMPGCAAGAQAVRAGDQKGAILTLLAIGDYASAVAALPHAAAATGLAPAEQRAYQTVATLFPQDVGAVLTPLLDYVALAVGEAVFVPAGVPHSYISGIGLEVMTSSDNVLRLGLTPKSVFIDEALTALDLDARPCVVRSTPGSRVAPAGSPFAATLVRDATVDVAEGEYRIILVIEGQARISTALADVDLRVGRAAALSADVPDATVVVDGLVAVVTSYGKRRSLA